MSPLQRYAFLAFFLINQFAFSQFFDSLVHQFVSNKHFTGANIALLAVDLTNHDTILTHNPNLAVVTASTTKLFSTAMALEILGPAHRFETSIYADGKIVNGTLFGNLWIRGEGDVTLGSKFFNADGQEFNVLDEWIDSLKAHGIKKISGKVIIDGSAFGYEGTPPGWSSWDAGNYFGAFPAGINIYDNIVKYYFETGKPGTKARLIQTYPKQPELNLTCKITSANVKGDDSNLQGKAYDENRIATGKLPAYKSSFMVKGSVANPELNFASILAERMATDSFEVSGGIHPYRNSGLTHPDYDSINRLVVQKGRSVQEIANWTNRKSVNFFAEGLLNGVAYKLSGSGKNSVAINIYKKFYASRIDTTGLRLNDGSGLSRNNRISTAHFCDLLDYMTTSPMANEFFASLPVAGINGTISDLCKGKSGDGRVYAKSGTMTGIKSYAGYVLTASGKKIAFAFVVNGYTCSQSIVKQQMEVLLNELALW